MWTDDRGETFTLFQVSWAMVKQKTMIYFVIYLQFLNDSILFISTEARKIQLTIIKVSKVIMGFEFLVFKISIIAFAAL